jgi:signal transduction histidine kinase
MEQTWTLGGQTQASSPATQHITAETEQTKYQMDVFRSILKVVVVVCGALGIAYAVPFLQQGAWPSLVISLTMLTMAGYSAIAVVQVKQEKVHIFVRVWLSLGTWTVFSFGLLQPNEFMNIMALGATVVIVFAIFLEPMKNSYRWALGNIGSYILVVLVRNSVHIPSFDLGILYSLVMYGTPVAVLLIMTEMGRVTTQHFKFNLIQSENRRKQLEIQGRQLTTYAMEADAAREKAERSDQVKSAFLASMSHELRTPLNAVINFTRFVIDGDTGDVNEEQKELLTDVVTSAKHLLNLINDVLDMSKIEAGSLNLFVEDEVNLSSIINTVISTGRGLLAEKPVRLQTDIETDLPLIRADRQRIMQILLNLMSNACKFTDVGEIIVRARRSEEKVMLTITDTGPGIASEDHQMIFEAFKQTQTGLRHGSGTGLGLAISRSLAEAHGGQLWLDSEPGKGATFSVSLPIKSEALILA